MLMHDPKHPQQYNQHRRCRVLKFEGGCNFRDIGGYRNRDGRELVWGRVFRTGVLSYFTALDEASLAQLGVKVICDLRRAEEREREQTRWTDATTEHLSWDDGAQPPTVRTFSGRHADTAAGMRLAMIDLYRALPTWMIPRLRGMFERIANGGSPMIVHCAAGKDRTGLAIALLLAALYVPHETIVEDYLLTNDAGDFEAFILSRHQTRPDQSQLDQSQQGLATTNHPLLALSDDVRRVLFAADADYLAAAFEQISQDSGSVTAFLRDRVGVDASMQRNLAAALLHG